MARRDFKYIRECGKLNNSIPAKPVPGIFSISGTEGKKSGEGSALNGLSKEQIGAII